MFSLLLETRWSPATADQGCAGGKCGAVQECSLHRGEYRPQVPLAHKLLRGESCSSHETLHRQQEVVWFLGCSWHMTC